MGRTHAAAYEKSSHVDQVRLLTTAQELEAVERLAGDYSKVSGIDTDAELFFKRGIDAVDICTPTPTHAAFVRRAIAARKPILCEKPLSLDPGQAEALLREAEAANVPFMSAQVIRFWPEYVFLKRAIDEGTLGQPLVLSMSRFSPLPNWGVNQWFGDLGLSGGALFDLHVHDIDFLQHALGLPRRLSAIGLKREGLAYTDISTTLDFGDDIRATIYASYERPAGSAFHMGYRALFDGGAIDYDIERTPTLRQWTGGAEQTMDFSEEPNGYERECDEFAGCVAQGKPPAVASAFSAIPTLRLLAAIARSADHAGQWIDVEQGDGQRPFGEPVNTTAAGRESEA